MGDGATPVRIESGASLAASYQVVVPFAFTISAASIEIDPFDLELDEDIREMLTEDVGSAVLTARLTNGFPFGAAAVVSFDETTETLFTDPDLELAPLQAPAAEVDENSGKTITATGSSSVVDLGDADLDTIAQPTIFLGVRIDPSPARV